jgi:multidrug transporter EmrE-like cation transporter
MPIKYKEAGYGLALILVVGLTLFGSALKSPLMLAIAAVIAVIVAIRDLRNRR